MKYTPNKAYPARDITNNSLRTIDKDISVYTEKLSDGYNAITIAKDNKPLFTLYVYSDFEDLKYIAKNYKSYLNQLS